MPVPPIPQPPRDDAPAEEWAIYRHLLDERAWWIHHVHTEECDPE